MPELITEDGQTLTTEDGAVLLSEEQTAAGLWTPVADFCELVRPILGDHDDNFRLYEDAAIARVIRGLVKMGQVDGLAIAADTAYLTPALATPAQWALLTWKACRTFVLPEATGGSWGMRAMRESVGNNFPLLMQLETSIYDAENPGMSSVLGGDWPAWCGWLGGLLDAPVYHVRRTFDGRLLLLP